METHDRIFMERAFELAEKGLGFVSPNPMVGCVIVHENKIIGEGWHQKYGGPHAEVNAINSVEDKSVLKKSTAYVSLEPCAHFGKTPPCADLLIRHELRKVIISNKDPFPKVNGGGIRKLKDAGISTEENLLEKRGKVLNRRFLTYHEKKRPYIILKWAETNDGFIARENFDSKWISNSNSRKLVHKWRAEEDAILVGTNTARYDNPSLNVRDWQGKNPLRLVIDKELSLSNSLNLFDGMQHTIRYNSIQDKKDGNLILKKIDPENLIQEILSDLYDRQVQSLIVEGGSQLINTFIAAELWDEARVFTAPHKFDRGIKAPQVSGTTLSQKNIYEDILTVVSRS